MIEDIGAPAALPQIEDGEQADAPAAPTAECPCPSCGGLGRLVIDRVKLELVPEEGAGPMDRVKLELVPDVDPELARVCMACLAPNPNDRPSSARRVANALARHSLSGNHAIARFSLAPLIDEEERPSSGGPTPIEPSIEHADLADLAEREETALRDLPAPRAPANDTLVAVLVLLLLLTSSALLTGSSVTISGKLYNQASRDIELISGGEILFYIKDPGYIGIDDIGTTSNIKVYTNNAEYVTEINIESATNQ